MPQDEPQHEQLAQLVQEHDLQPQVAGDIVVVVLLVILNVDNRQGMYVLMKINGFARVLEFPIVQQRFVRSGDFEGAKYGLYTLRNSYKS